MGLSIFDVVLGGLETFKQGVGATVVGDVRKEVVGERGESSRLNFGSRQLGADKISRRSLSQGEYSALRIGPPQLALNIRHSIVVMGGICVCSRAHQMAGCRRYFPPKGFDMSGLSTGSVYQRIIGRLKRTGRDRGP